MADNGKDLVSVAERFRQETMRGTIYILQLKFAGTQWTRFLVAAITAHEIEDHVFGDAAKLGFEAK
jgi:hypothetical protein